MITPELKDKILNHLVNNSVDLSCQINIKPYAELFYIGRNELEAILNQFNSKNLIAQTKYLGGLINIRLTAEAYDFLLHGGFVVQEKILKNEFDKLILELESLKPSIGKKAEIITSIIGGISSALALFR